MKSNRIC